MQETWVPSLGRADPWRGKWQPAPVFLVGKYSGQGSLVGNISQGHKRVRHNLATKDQITLSICPTLSSPGVSTSSFSTSPFLPYRYFFFCLSFLFWTWKLLTLRVMWRKEWQSTAVFLPGKFHGQRSLAGYSPWGHQKSDRPEHTLSWG